MLEKNDNNRIAIITIIVGVILSFWNVLLDPLRSIQEDTAFMFQGLHAAVNEQIWSGQFPHWYVNGMGGERFFADINLALFYPGTILFRFLPFDIALVGTWIFHFSATALILYTFCRVVLKLKSSACVLAGLIFALGGFSRGHTNHINFGYSMPYFPLLLLVGYNLYNSKGLKSLIWWHVGLFSFCFLILSSGIAILPLSVFGLIWISCVFALGDLKRGEYRRLLKYIFLLLVMVFVILGLTAFQWIPTLDFYSLTVRTEWTAKDIAGSNIPFRTLFYQLISPGIFGNRTIGYWTHVGHERLTFITGTGLTFFLISLFYNRKHSWFLSIFILLLVSVIFAVWPHYSIDLVTNLFPVKMRTPARYVGLVQLSLSMLIAIGVDFWLRETDKNRTRITIIISLFVGVIMWVYTIWLLKWLGDAGNSLLTYKNWLLLQSLELREWLSEASPKELFRVTASRAYFQYISMAFFCSGGFIVLVGTVLKKKKVLRVATPLILIWCFIELLLFGTGTWAGQKRFIGVLDKSPPLIKFLQENLGDDRYFNSANYFPLWEDRSAIYGLSSFGGYFSGGFIRKTFYNLQKENEIFHKMLSMFSTKYIILKQRGNRQDSKAVFKDKGFYIIENPAYLKRVRFLTKVKSVGSNSEAIEMIKNIRFNPRTTGLITGDLLVKEKLMPRVTKLESIKITKWMPGKIEFDVSCEFDRWVFISTAFDKGWRGFIDGKPISLYSVNTYFNTVNVPSGNHHVEMNYITPKLNVGLSVSAISIFLLILANLIIYFRLKV